MGKISKGPCTFLDSKNNRNTISVENHISVVCVPT